jgi:hypothetical protein
MRTQFHSRARGPPSHTHWILRYCDRGMWRSLNTDDAVSHRYHERLELRVRAKLGEDVDHVGALRLDRDVQLHGDLPVRSAVGQCLQHLPLARGQLGGQLPPNRDALPLPAGLAQDLDQVARVDRPAATVRMASTISPIAAVFCTTPAAPAS